MKTIVALTLSCLVALAAFSADSPSLVFQIRLVADQPSSDTEQLTVAQRPESKREPEVLLVQKTVLLDETSLQAVRVDRSAVGTPVIDVFISEKGAKRFAEVTGQNIDKRLAVIFDGRVRCTPVIKTEITGGKVEISGFFSEQEAKDLVAKLTKTIQK